MKQHSLAERKIDPVFGKIGLKRLDGRVMAAGLKADGYRNASQILGASLRTKMPDGATE
jgi:hypothetical protein